MDAVFERGCNDGRRTVALLCTKYEGRQLPMEGAFLGVDNAKYRKLVIYLKQARDVPLRTELHGCRVYYISKLDRFRGFNVPAVCKLARILKAEQVDILHCHRHQATVYGAFAGRIAGTPVILAHVHGLNRSRKARRKLMNMLVFQWVSKVLAVGEGARQDVIRCNWSIKPEQVICLNNSIDCDRFASVAVSREEVRRRLGLRPEAFVFAAVGRLVPTKGLTYLVRAFAAVRAQQALCELVFVGEGRSRKELEGLARSLGVENSVHFLGYRQDVEWVLRGMDAFVMASVAEGMPGALLEAMASGLPCIATAVGAIPEVLENGRLGVLVPAEDNDALAVAMLRVSRDAGAFAESAALGRQKVLEAYDHASLTRAMEAVYESEYHARRQPVA